jgi:hypothetical protein
MPGPIKNIAIAVGYALLALGVGLQVASVIGHDLRPYFVDLQDDSLRILLLVLSVSCFFASFWQGLLPALWVCATCLVAGGVLFFSPPNLLDSVVSLSLVWMCLVSAYRKEVHYTEFGSAIHAVLILCLVSIFCLSIARLEAVQLYLSAGFGLSFSTADLVTGIIALGLVFAASVYRGWFLLSALAVLPLCLLSAATLQLSPLLLCYEFGVVIAALCFIASRRGARSFANEGI